MKIPFRTPVHLRTSMPKEQVVQRLGETLRSNFWQSIFPWFGSPVVIGRANNERCRMRYRTWHNNSFQRQLRLSIVSVDGGTALDGEFSVDIAVLIFFAFWLTGVSCFCVLFLWRLLSSRPASGESQYWLLMPFGMLLFGVALIRIGLWLSSLSEPRVLEFVRELIGAEPIDRDTSSQS